MCHLGCSARRLQRDESGSGTGRVWLCNGECERGESARMSSFTIMRGGIVMAPNAVFSQLLFAALVLVCLIIHVWWPDPLRAAPPPPSKPLNPQRKRAQEPPPFPGYIHKPLCEACAHGLDSHPKAPGSPPPVMSFPRGRKRPVDTPSQCCPDPDGAYHGWLGRGNIRANGHPGGQPWRQ